MSAARAAGYTPWLVGRRARLNEHLPLRVAERLVALIRETRGSAEGARLAVLGWAYKGWPPTDDMRGAPVTPMLPIFRAGRARPARPRLPRGAGRDPRPGRHAGERGGGLRRRRRGAGHHQPSGVRQARPAARCSPRMRRPAVRLRLLAHPRRGRARGGRACATRGIGLWLGSSSWAAPASSATTWPRAWPPRATRSRSWTTSRAAAGDATLDRARRAARCRASSRRTSRDPARSTRCRASWDQVYMLAAVVGVRNVETRPGAGGPGEHAGAAAPARLAAGRAARRSSSRPPARPTRAVSPRGTCRSRRPRTCRSAVAGRGRAPLRLRGEQDPRRGGGDPRRAAPAGSASVIGRFHNVYGPRMGADHVIPELALRALAPRGPVPGLRRRAAPRLLPRRRRGRGDDAAPDGHRGGVRARS